MFCRVSYRCLRHFALVQIYFLYSPSLPFSPHRLPILVGISVETAHNTFSTLAGGRYTNPHTHTQWPKQSLLLALIVPSHSPHWHTIHIHEYMNKMKYLGNPNFSELICPFYFIENHTRNSKDKFNFLKKIKILYEKNVKRLKKYLKLNFCFEILEFFY